MWGAAVTATLWKISAGGFLLLAVVYLIVRIMLAVQKHRRLTP